MGTVEVVRPAATAGVSGWPFSLPKIRSDDGLTTRVGDMKAAEVFDGKLGKSCPEKSNL